MSGMVFKMGGGAGTIKKSSAPQITFDGKWSGWHVEYYNDEPYWEALFSSSGTLVSIATYLADLWGIGGGGAGGNRDTSYVGGKGLGGGSGYTNMVENTTITPGGHAVTIGAGGNKTTTWYDPNDTQSQPDGDIGATGGSTIFLTLTCNGGQGGQPSSASAGSGGSNGGTSGKNGGSNGSPGAGKIMSKFWSTEHNHEYGAAGVGAGSSDPGVGGGGGGYLDVGAPNSINGHGYGGGGGGYDPYANYSSEWYGNSGCLIIRIKIN